MPHQCVRCGTMYDDGAKEILSGCQCGAKLFFYIKKDKLEQAKQISENLTKKEKEQIEDDVFDIMGKDKAEEDKPVVLDLESIRVIKPGKFEDVIREIKKQKALCSIAHPYTFGLRKSIGNIFGVREANAVEAFNARSLTNYENKKAKQLAKKLKRAETGGSDAHFPWEIGRGYTLFEGNLKDALNAKANMLYMTDHTKRNKKTYQRDVKPSAS